MPPPFSPGWILAGPFLLPPFRSRHNSDLALILPQMNSKRICELCEDTGYTASSIGLFVGMIVALVVVVYFAAKSWKAFSWKHFARCSFQPGRILITYSQITSQLGDVLDFTYPGVFGDVIEALRPIMDLWGLLFRALGPSECFGIKGFTAKWLLRIVGMPIVCVVIVSALYLYNVHNKGKTKAKAEAKGHTFMVVFFCCEYTMRKLHPLYL